ncbi:MAG: hypothetical protein Q9202_006573 [Teloschistes flavicans]
MECHHAVIHTSPSTPLSVQSVPKPSPGPGSAIVKILATPVLAYTKEVLTGKRPYPLSLPLTPGMSAIGRVTATGPDATALRPGALVLCDIFLTARDSPSSHFLMGVHAGGPVTKPLMDGEWRHSTWAEHAKFPLENLYPLDEDLLLRKHGYSVRDLCTLPAALVPFGGLDEIGLRVGETVVIAPATGAFGGAAVSVALAMGASVIAMGRNQDTLGRLNDTFGATNRLSTVTMTGTLEGDMAALRAASATTHGFSAYLDLSPPSAALNTYFPATLSLLAPGGRIAVMGGYGGNLEIPCGMIVHKQLKLVGKYMYTREQVERCFRMAETGVLGLGEKAGVRTVGAFGLWEVETAVDTAKDEANVWGRQVLLEPWGEGERI